jgi:Carboxypeptidase regulatory-like domain/Tetratricopeptide repeat
MSNRACVLTLVCLPLVGLTSGSLAAPAAAQTLSGRIIGTIVDDQGTPVDGASIEVRNPQATPPLRSSTSDESGRFGLMGLRSGTWMVLVEAKGHEPTALAIDVQSPRPGAAVTIPLLRIAQLNPPTFAEVSAAAVMKDLEQADRLVAQGKAAEAIALYDAILAKAPALTSVQLAIGRAARAGQDFVRAQAAYTALLAKEPGSLRGRYELGLTYQAAGDAGSARRELERVVREGGDAPIAALARERLKTLPL